MAMDLKRLSSQLAQVPRQADVTDQKVPLSCFLLDDDPIDIRYVSWLLRQVHGFDLKIKSANSVQDARAMCSIEQFDLYLLDYWLGEEESVALLQDLQAQSAANRTIVVISSLDDQSFQETSLKSGADLFLAKQDLSKSVLESMMRNVVHLATRHQASHQQKLLNEEKIFEWTRYLHSELDKVHGFTSLALSALETGDQQNAKQLLKDALGPLLELRNEASCTNLGMAAIQKRGHVNLQPFDVGKLLVDLVEECRLEAEQFDKNLDICEHVADSIILSDPVILRELIEVLLRGSIRFGGDASEVAVSYELNDHHLEIYISEFGDWDEDPLSNFQYSSANALEISDLFGQERSSTLFVAEHLLQLLNGNWSIGRQDENIEIICRIPLNYDLLN